MQTEMKSKLVGVTFRDGGEDRQLNIKMLQAGQQVFWQHESENPFDPNAIKVFADAELKRPLGYIQRELAKDIMQQQTLGYTYQVFVVAVTGGAGRSFGCNIRIVATKGGEGI